MNNKAKTVRFSGKMDNSFFNELKQRVDDYFKSRNTSRRANTSMIAKMIFIGFIFIGSYAALLSNRFSETAMLALAILFGISKVMIAFNVGHDASHGALFKSQKLNNLFSYSFNLVGVNRYIWNIKHNVSHHAFTNVPGYDMDIEQIKIARLVEHVPQKAHFKFQHIYLPLIYPLASLYMIFIKDFQMFATKKYGNSLYYEHPRKEYIILFASKAFYFLYALVIPLLLIKLVWWKILLGFIISHLVVGSLISYILFLAHVLEDSPFPNPNEEGLITGDWAKHQVETTINFGARNRFLIWFCGGLNLHIVHHIFPSVCHIHYYPLSKIVREVAYKHQVKHRDISFSEALRSHFAYIKKMGTKPDTINFNYGINYTA